MSDTNNQNAQLLQALRQQPMTAMDILQQLGIARASARVFDLREEGHNICSRMITVRNRHGQHCRVALYSLPSVQTTLIPTHPGRGFTTAREARP